MIENITEDPCPWKKTAVCIALCILLVPAGQSHAAPGTKACFDGSPGTTVPELIQNERIWPPSGLQPAAPGARLASDNTRYTGGGTQFPRKGLEMWTDLDIVGNYLYTSYNSGLRIWDISGANAAKPKRLAVRDGFSKNFLKFEDKHNEVYFLVFGLDAIDPPGAGDDVLVALAGRKNVGFTIWDATDKKNLRQLYQDWQRRGEDVAAGHVGGRTYAFYAAHEGGGSGLHVYDMTAARSLSAPCLEDAVSAPACGSVYKGKLGSRSKVRFVSYLEHANRHFVASSDGASGFGVEIHEVTDPSRAQGTLVFSGLQRGTQGVQFFGLGGRAYLALKGLTDMQVFDVTACLASRNCSTLQTPSPVWSETVGRGATGSLVSVSQGRDPYVYFGTTNSCQRGTKKEFLFNVGDLGSPAPVIEEATAFPADAPANADGKFSDPSTGLDVDYWGYYLDRNTTGFSFVIPRAAKVHRGANGADYVYRTAYSILDVHVFSPNAPSATIDGPDAAWLGDPVTFTAAPRNCGGAAKWQWWYREGSRRVELGRDGATRTERWNVGPRRSVEVGAVKSACADGETMDAADVTTQVVDLRDPRPRIAGISPSGDQVPQGRKLSFSAAGAISGKPPFDFKWRVFDGRGTELAGLRNTRGKVFTLDTCGLKQGDSSSFFEDNFESGDVGRWNVRRLAGAMAAAGAGENRYTVQLTATSKVAQGSFSDTESAVIDVIPAGTPRFVAPSIAASDLGGGRYRLSVKTNGLETEVSWQIQDANGPANCNFGGVRTRCVVHDWGQKGSELAHQWSAPNVAGLYKVSARIRSLQCDGSSLPATPPRALVDVRIDSLPPAEAPKITLLEVVPGGSANCECSIFLPACVCQEDRPVTFRATTSARAGALVFDWGDGQVETFQSPAVDGRYTHTYTTANVYSVKVKIQGDDATQVGRDVQIQ